VTKTLHTSAPFTSVVTKDNLGCCLKSPITCPEMHRTLTSFLFMLNCLSDSSYSYNSLNGVNAKIFSILPLSYSDERDFMKVAAIPRAASSTHYVRFMTM